MTDLLPKSSVVSVSMKYGSHVYGTDLPTSDVDIKGVYIPPAHDILLQRVRSTISVSTKSDPTKANKPSDIDTEYFSLQRFIELLLEGQSNAMDMVFTPESHYLSEPHPSWTDIRTNRRRFLHSGVTMFARYCRQQAAKYGIKGSRVAALRTTLEFLEPLHDHDKLENHLAALRDLVATHSAAGGASDGHLRIIDIDEAPIHRTGKYLEVAGRKVPIGATIKLARQTLRRLFDEFGQRALLAEKNQGVDWKALMHAVRVSKQAEELLLSGTLTFPRPEKDLLLNIRLGHLPYKKVAEMVEDGVEAMERAATKSVLPTAPDRVFADELVQHHYARQIERSLP